jgi:hypothetical protein
MNHPYGIAKAADLGLPALVESFSLSEDEKSSQPCDASEVFRRLPRTPNVSTRVWHKARPESFTPFELALSFPRALVVLLAVLFPLRLLLRRRGMVLMWLRLGP